MVILVEFSSRQTDNDRPFMVTYDILVKIVTQLEGAELIVLARLINLVSTDVFNELVKEILDNKMHFSTQSLRESAFNRCIEEESQSRYHLVQANTIYDSENPGVVAIAIELGLNRQNMR